MSNAPFVGEALQGLQIPGEVDDRSPWSLLANPAEVRALLTAHLHDALEIKRPEDALCSPQLGDLFLKFELQDDRDAEYFSDFFDPLLRPLRTDRARTNRNTVSVGEREEPLDSLLVQMREWSQAAKVRAEDLKTLEGYVDDDGRVANNFTYEGNSYPRRRFDEILAQAHANQRRDYETATNLDHRLERVLLRSGGETANHFWQMFRHSVLLESRLEAIQASIGGLHQKATTLRESDRRHLEDVHEGLNAHRSDLAAILNDAGRIPIVGLTNCPEGTTLASYLSPSAGPSPSRPAHGEGLVDWCAEFYYQVSCALINAQRLQVKCAAAMVRMLRKNEHQAPI